MKAVIASILLAFSLPVLAQSNDETLAWNLSVGTCSAFVDVVHGDKASGLRIFNTLATERRVAFSALVVYMKFKQQYTLEKDDPVAVESCRYIQQKIGNEAFRNLFRNV